MFEMRAKFGEETQTNLCTILGSRGGGGGVGGFMADTYRVSGAGNYEQEEHGVRRGQKQKKKCISPTFSLSLIHIHTHTEKVQRGQTHIDN